MSYLKKHSASVKKVTYKKILFVVHTVLNVIHTLIKKNIQYLGRESYTVHTYMFAKDM